MSNKDYDHIITILTREILKKRLAIFIGAGCSGDAGLPSWKQLLENLVTKYGIQTKENNLLKLASRIERAIGHSNFVDEVSDFCRALPMQESAIHKLLTELDTNLYITTNYDHLLENAFRKKGIEPHVLRTDLDLAVLNPTAKTIVKLHGDIDAPSSLVLTEKDYRQYKTKHRGFTDWLKAKATELTILFLGTSFDDPRLIEADDHVIEFFGENKRNHVIVLRRPPERNGHDIDSKAELEDFEDRCRSFETDRSILVITIRRYEEIKDLLQELKNRVLEAHIEEQQSTGQNSGMYRLRAEHFESLDKKFVEHLDSTVRELCAEIASPGCFPSFSKTQKKIDQLLGYLQSPPHKLSPETVGHGYLALVDAFAATGRPEDAIRAFEYYKQAEAAISVLKEENELARRVLRAKAKLLFLKGDFQSGLEILKDDESPKAIFWRLSILLASDRLDDAYSLIKKHDPVQVEWAGEAARVLIGRGDLEAAEAIYKKFTITPDSFQTPDGINRLRHQMALAYFRRAIALEGNPVQTIPGQLSHAAHAACQKALHYLDDMSIDFEHTDPNENVLVAESLITRMQILDLIGNYAEALDVAKYLLNFRPVPQEAANYSVFRGNTEQKNNLLALTELLAEDHPEEEWAWVMRTKLFAMVGEYEKAWNILFQVKARVQGEEGKKELAWVASELGISTGNKEMGMTVLEELIDQEDPFFRFLLAKNLFSQDRFDEAYKILQEVTKSNLPPAAQSEAHVLMARIHMKSEDWQSAKGLLKIAISKFYNPLNLKALIYVGSQERDDAIILDTSIKLEQLGWSDEETLYAKAQAAFNLARYDLSSETWKTIYDHDKSPEAALKLATVLRAMGEYDNALEILKEHTSDRDAPERYCLHLYCIILDLLGRPDEAFRQLDARLEAIKDLPELLVLHLNLAYRLNHENRAHLSMQRLMDLQNMGKVAPNLLWRVSLEEFKETIEGSRKRREFAIDQYRLGRLPRALLCEIDNRPYYLDWAVRTQEMHMPDDARIRLEYSVYSTNSLRMGLRHDARDLVPISVPAESQETVIDLSALITLHRLNLLPLVEKNFKSIYYPKAFHWLWDLDRPRYAYHQRSQALLYREIENFLITGKIGKLEITNAQDHKNNTDRLITLAKLEDMPIVTAWSNKDEWNDVDEGGVVWISQVIDWLYKTGRIGEDKYRESVSLLTGEPGRKEQDSLKKLQTAGRLMFDKGAIEFLVKNDLLNPLLSQGVRPVLEAETAFYFEQEVRELDFLEGVGKWQQDIEAVIKTSKVFQAFPLPVPEHDHGYYIDIIASTLKFCKEHKLSLLADDRAMQMVSESGWEGGQYGTDALLLELLNQDKITLDQYARYFMQLIKWRYRFLLPDARLLLYLAKQYKHHPLGSELTEIADYGRHCMEDVGLFLGPEPTDPPKPLGAVLYLKWIDAWAKLLCDIWTDKDFDQDGCIGITRKVLMQAIPPPPKGLHPEVRERLGGSEEMKVLFAIVQLIMESEECLKLSGLLHEAFSFYGIDPDRQADTLREHFLSLVRIALSDNYRLKLISNPDLAAELSKQNLTYDGFVKEKVLRKNLARMLVAYHGSQDIPTPSPFSDLMEEYGMYAALIKDSDTEGEDLPRGNEVLRGDILVSPFDGPLFKITGSDETKEEIAFAHDILNHPHTLIRMQAFHKLMALDGLSEPTRTILDNLKGSLSSEIKSQWEPAAYKARQVIMKDFRYCRMHLKKTLLYRVEDKKVISDAIKNLLFPEINTVLVEAPAVVKFAEQNLKEISKDLIEALKPAQENGKYNIEVSLDQYMNQFGFVAFAPPFDAWSILYDMCVPSLKSDQGAGDFCAAVSRWAYKQDDPLALLVAWEVLLGVAGNSGETAYFRGIDFKKMLGSLFLDLAVREYRSGNQKENSRRRFLEKAWEARTYLAQHYLRYLEIESNKIDDQQVLAAWWMAKKTMETFLKSMGARGNEEKVNLIEKHIIPNWISNTTSSTYIQYQLFHLPKITQSASHYCTFVAKRHLAAAMMAFIAPSTDGLPAPGYAGIAMTDVIRDGMLGLLKRPDDLALAHLPTGQCFTLLWNRSLTQSVPSFLRAYYKDNIEFVGKEKMSLLQSAEMISTENYPEEVLKELLNEISKPLVFNVFLALEIVALKLATGGELTAVLKSIFARPHTLRDLVAIDESAGPLAAVSLARLLPYLYLRDEKGLAHEIENQLLEADWDLLKEIAVLMIERVIFASLLVTENELFKKLLEAGHKNKEFNRGLLVMKDLLGNYFSQVPASHRERVRYMLRELETIPEIKQL